MFTKDKCLKDNIRISDSIPVLGAAATWATSNIDFVISRGIGLATLIFTVLKIVHLIKHWNKKNND